MVFQQRMIKWKIQTTDNSGYYREQSVYVVFTAIMFAVLTAQSEEAEAFCVHILNEVISENQGYKQMELYFYMLALMNAMGITADKLTDNVECIRRFGEWVPSVKMGDWLFFKQAWKRMSGKLTMWKDDANRLFESTYNTYIGMNEKSEVMYSLRIKRERL